jgi:hypothetical protein
LVRRVGLDSEEVGIGRSRWMGPKWLEQSRWEGTGLLGMSRWRERVQQGSSRAGPGRHVARAGRGQDRQVALIGAGVARVGWSRWRGFGRHEVGGMVAVVGTDQARGAMACRRLVALGLAGGNWLGLSLGPDAARVEQGCRDETGWRARDSRCGGHGRGSGRSDLSLRIAAWWRGSSQRAGRHRVGSSRCAGTGWIGSSRCRGSR